MTSLDPTQHADWMRDQIAAVAPPSASRTLDTPPMGTAISLRRWAQRRNTPNAVQVAAVLDAAEAGNPIGQAGADLLAEIAVAQYDRVTLPRLAAALTADLPGSCGDWLGALQRADDAAQAKKDAKLSRSPSANAVAGERVVVYVNGQGADRPQDEVNTEARQALLALDGQYTRSGALAQPTAEGDVRQIDAAGEVRHELSRAVAFARYEDGDPVVSPPPDWCVQYLTATHLQGRELVGVLRRPCLGYDGTVHTSAGYYDGFLLQQDVAHTPMSVEHARAAMLEPLRDFAFEMGETGRAVAIASVLTVVARDLVWRWGGNVPGFAVDAPEGGAGKTLLTDVLLGMSGARSRGVGHDPRPEEVQKRFVGAALTSPDAIVFSNVRTGSAFGFTLLDDVMTSGRNVDLRALGSSKISQAPWRSTIFVNGNQITYAGEAARRFLHCRIVKPARVTRSEAELRRLVSQHSQVLISAALSLLSAHMREACGVLHGNMPSFELWSQLVAGCVVRYFGADPTEAIATTLVADEGVESLSTGVDRMVRKMEAEPSVAGPKNEPGDLCQRVWLGRAKDMALLASAECAELYGALKGGRPPERMLNVRQVGWMLRQLQGRTGFGWILSGRMLHGVRIWAAVREV